MSKTMELDFIVTICLGNGRNGDIEVSAHVSKEEFGLLVNCYNDGEDIVDYEGLEDLYGRILSAAKDEIEFFNGEDFDYCDASFWIEFPDEVCEQ